MSVPTQPLPLPAVTRSAVDVGGSDGDWLEAGRSERCLWGRYQGSRPDPYETVVLLAAITRNSCSCPSRRRPCKHVRALVALGGAGRLPSGAEPDYASRWVGRLTAPAAPAIAQPAAPADPEAAQRRAQLRRERVSDGLEELDRWLGDQVRTGLAALPRAGYAHFDRIAARMVDAQAPGVAGSLRAIPGDLVGEGWPERALHALAGLHLLVRAHQRLDELPEQLAATVRSRIGYPQAKSAVLATPGVADTWWPVGAVDSVEYQLESRRVWLRGVGTGRWALWLTFAAPGQELDPTVQPGRPLVADLHFYPGSGHRAVVGAAHNRPAATLLAVGSDLAEVRRRFAAELAGDPWAGRMPALLQGTPVPPDQRPGDWLLRDAHGEACPLLGLAGEPWPLLAQSAGRPLTVFGEWNGAGLLPLSVLPDVDGRRFSTQVVG
jgi:hypothetical protein